MAAAWDDTLARWEGVLLMSGMAIATVFLLAWSRHDVKPEWLSRPPVRYSRR